MKGIYENMTTATTNDVIARYNKGLAELTAFSYANLSDFNKWVESMLEVCEDPFIRAAIEESAQSVAESSFQDGTDTTKRDMIVVDQRFVDKMLDLRIALS